MTLLPTFCDWLYQLPASTALRESDNAFPWVETAHVLSTSLFAGSLVVVDLRILMAIFGQQPASRIAAALLPWTWVGLGLMLLSGLPLFASEAADLYGNIAFRIKLALLLLAGMNALLFHLTVFRGVAQWDIGATPLAARAFAGISILLWTGVIVAGRLIAIFHSH